MTAPRVPLTVPASDAGNPYDELVAERREGLRTDVRRSFLKAGQVTPDQHAKTLDTASRLGVAPQIVEWNPDAAADELTRRSSPYDDLVRRSPRLAEWIRNPDNAAVVGTDPDEIGRLAAIDVEIQSIVRARPGFWRNLGRGLASGVLAGQSGIGHAADAFGEQLSGTPGLPIPQSIADPIRRAGRVLAANAKTAREEFYRPTVGSIGEVEGGGDVRDYLAYQLGAGVGTIGAVVAGTLAGGPGGGVAAGGTLAFGDVRDELEDLGMEAGPTKNALALSLAVPVAALDRITPGQIASKLLLRGAPQAIVREAAQHGLTRAVAAEALKTAAREGGTEVGQELIQYLGTRAATGTDIDAGELATRAADAAIGGALAGGTLGGLAELPRIRQAQRNGLFFQALGQQTTDAKLLERMPAKMQEAVERMTADGPVETAYVDAETWTEYWQGQNADPAQAAEEVLGQAGRAALAEAVRTGAPLAIPTARYAVTIAPTEHNAFFTTEMRLGKPDAMNAREADELAKALGTVEEETTGESAADPAEASLDESASQVEADVIRQLVEAGEDESTAATNAAVVRAFFRTAGQRTGQDPLALYQRYGVQIAREGVEAPAPVQGPPVTREQIVERAMAFRERRAEREAVQSEGVETDPYRIPERERDQAATTDAGEFVYARTPGGVLRANLSKVSVDGLVDEYARLSELNAQENTAATIDAKDVDEGNRPHVGMKGAAVQAAGRIAQRRKTLAKLDAELVRRGVTDLDDRLFRRISGAAMDEESALDFSFEQGTVPGQAPGRTLNQGAVAVDEDAQARDASDRRMLAAQAGPGQPGITVEGERGGILRIVARDESGQPIGLLSLVPNGEGVVGQDADVLGVYVLPEHRRRGVASALYDAAAENGLTIRSGQSGFTDDGKAFIEARKASGARVLFQESKGMNRGRIQIGQTSIRIDLLASADLSTFLHEFAHLADHVLEQESQRDDAPAEMREMYGTLRAWVGAEDGAALTVEQREQIARGFETYLLEGKAPTTALARVFATFRAWLTFVYRALLDRARQDPLAVRLTDDVRRVFDRMLATDEEIAQAQAQQAMVPLFSDPAAVGMTEKQAADYAEAVADARRVAEEELSAKLMAQVKREQEAVWKAERAKVRAEVAAEVNTEPVSLAVAHLTRGTMPDGTALPEGVPVVKLSRDALVNEYATRPEYDNLLRRLPRPYVYARDGGTSTKEIVHPDEAAALFGFRSGDELIQALLTAENPRKRIENLTDERMRERHGDLLTDAELPVEAMKAVHNEKRAELLRRELEVLARQDLPALKGLVRKVSRRVPPIAAVREEAERTIAAKRVRDINPLLYQRGEAKAARLSVEALLKGDVETAFAEKQKELLNHELYRAATQARETVDGIVDYLRTFSKATTRARIGKAGGDYLAQIDAIRERYDVARVSDKALDARRSLLAWVTEQEAQGIPVTVPDELLNEARRRHYREATVEELIGVRDTVKQIAHLARTKNVLLASARARDLEEARSEIVAGIRAHHTIRTDPLPHAPGMRAKLKQGLRRVAAEHTRLEFLFRHLDGHQANGPLWSYFFKPLVEAENAENTLRAEDAAALKEIMGAYTRKERAEWFTKRIHVREAVSARSDGTFTKEHLLAVALNVGNEYNRDALKRGFGWDDRALNAILAKLDARDWTTVQAIWDHIDRYWPDAQKLEREITGLAPEKVEATPIETPAGTLRGGYYPIVFDGDRSTRQAALDEAADVSEMFGGMSAKAMTRHGHLKARTNTGGKPLRLSLSVATDHLAQVVHDLTHRRAVIDLGRLIRDDQIREAIEGAAGTEMYRQLGPWLKAVAGDRPKEPSDFFRKLASHARAGATVVTLGWKVTSSMMQTLGYTAAVDEIGAKYAAKGVQRTFPNVRAAYRFATERSAMMRDRLENFDRDVRETVRQPTRFRLTAPDLGFFALIGWMDMGVSLPSWLGAYAKAMDGKQQGIEPGDEQAAIDYADSVVRMTQSAGAAKDLASIQRGGEVQRLFTMFYSSFSVIYNRFQSAGQRFGMDKNVPRLLSTAVLMWFLPVVLEEAIRGRGPDEDDDESWAAYLTRKALFYPFGSIVLVRDIASALEWQARTGRSDFQGSPAMRAGEAIVGAAGAVGAAVDPDEEVTRRQARDIADALGVVLKLPSRQAWTTLEVLYDWMTGEDTPESAAQGLWRAVVSGKPRE